jgi:hypothetical protein
MKPAIIVFLAILPGAQMIGAQDEVRVFNITSEIRGCLAAVGPHYKVSGRINPFYLRGDFRGGGAPETAVLVTATATGARGVAVCWDGLTKPTILGAGTVFHQMPDLSFDAWHVYRKGPVHKGVEGGPPPVLRGEALLLEWSESASGLVYWDGKALRWYQQGD